MKQKELINMNQITRYKNRMDGSPSINNRRINVYNVVSLMESYLEDIYEGFQDLLTDYDIPQDFVIEILKYCSMKECKKVLNCNFCEQCILSPIYEKRIPEYSENSESFPDLSINNPEEYDFVKGWEISKRILSVVAP